MAQKRARKRIQSHVCLKMPIGNPRNTLPSFGCFPQHTTYYFYHMMKLVKCSDRNVMYLRVSGPLGFISTWVKIAADLFFGIVRDTVNKAKIDPAFPLMWFTFILFYSYLRTFMDIHFTWAKWIKMANTMNRSEQFEHWKILPKHLTTM